MNYEREAQWRLPPRYAPYGDSFGGLNDMYASERRGKPRKKTEELTITNPNTNPNNARNLSIGLSTTNSNANVTVPASSGYVPEYGGYVAPLSLPLPSPEPYPGNEANLHELEWFAARASDPNVAVGTTSSGMPAGTEVLGGRHSSPALFGVDTLGGEYETSSYSLWNGTPTGTAMTSDAATPNAVYLPEEDLKMGAEYSSLTELNQGDLEYFYGSMEPNTAGNNTPINMSNSSGGSSGSAVGGFREQAIERMLTGGNNAGVPKPMRPTRSTPKMGNAPTMTTSVPASRPAQAQAQTQAQAHSRMPTGYRSFQSPPASMLDTKRPRIGINTNLPPTANDPMASTMLSPAASASSLGTMTPLGTRRTGGALPKRPRSRQCDHPGCTNRARSHQKCKKHGGAHQCVFDGCTKNSQSRGLCIAHGGGSRCKVEGCTRASQSKGLCKSHGGGEFCAVEGCRKKAHLKHLCRTHGGGVRCKSPKCVKWAQRKGWCMAHAKEMLGP